MCTKGCYVSGMQKKKKKAVRERLVVLITAAQKAELTRMAKEKRVSIGQLVRERLFSTTAVW
jgi:hypothetical protein